MGILDAPFQPPTRVQNWLRSFRAPQARFATMASPPTITFGGNTSSVDGSKTNGQTTVGVTDARMQSLGSIFASGISGGLYNVLVPNHITDSVGAKSGKTAPIRVRFETDAPEVDFCFLDSAFSQFNLVIDGQYAYRNKCVTFTNTGNYRYIKASFGADTVTYAKAQTNFAITAQGSGHAVGDIVTLDGGSGAASGTPCTIKITQVSSGAVTGVDIVNPGAYTAQPTGTFSQASTTGSGTGLQVTAQFFSPVHSSRKMRTWELIYHQPCTFLGIVVPSVATVLPYKASTNAPKLSIIGDSITIGTYLAYGGSHMGCSIAQKLGLWDNHIISGIGGTGWLTASDKWSGANRVADFISYDSDIYLFMGSQNDVGQDPTLLANAVRDTLNAILAAKPKAYIVGVGNIMGDNTNVANYIGNGFAAVSDPSRVAYINSQTPYKFTPSTDIGAWGVTGDLNHPSQDGLDRYAELVTPLIYQTLASLVRQVNQ